MIKYKEEDCNTILAALKMIRGEMGRLSYNKYQKDMLTPFDNSGMRFSNSTFTVRAYYWDDDDEEIQKPNFEYKDLKVYWYKYLGRGMYATCEHELTFDDIETMIKECFESLREGGIKE